MHHIADPALMQRTLDAAAAFGAPYNVVFGGVDEGATFTSCVERRGKLSLGTELGGWGRVNVPGVRIGKRGCENILKHLGVIEGTPDTAQDDGSPGTRHMQVGGRECYSFAPGGGIFEPVHVVGQAVRAGQPAGWLHFVEDVDRPAQEVRYGSDGILWMSAGPGRVARGDTVAVVMQDYR
jgi:N-alpha-acetyl-L-2,4-diaminobutyrate deacetylase